MEYFLKYLNNQYNITDFLGLMGGMISLYVKITRTVGKFVLVQLYKWKMKEKNRLLHKINIPIIENDAVEIDINV